MQGPARLFGVYTALVKDVCDPDGQGRVQIELPAVEAEDGGKARAWARLATMMAGNERGSWFIPEPDDEVLVTFIAGDPRHPVVIGALWNGQDAAPEAMDGGGKNDVRSITSRSGSRLAFSDAAGAPVVEVHTPAKRTVILDDGANSITVKDPEGNKIVIETGGRITVTAKSTVTIKGEARVEVEAGMVQVTAPMSKFSGVIHCDSIITNATVSTTYTPGAGNVW